MLLSKDYTFNLIYNILMLEVLYTLWIETCDLEAQKNIVNILIS
jgi:hypothetical protein